jgi:hypothetical protein
MLGPLERASPNHWTSDWIESENSIFLKVIHHRQNPIVTTCCLSCLINGPVDPELRWWISIWYSSLWKNRLSRREIAWYFPLFSGLIIADTTLQIKECDALSYCILRSVDSWITRLNLHVCVCVRVILLIFYFRITRFLTLYTHHGLCDT